MPTNAENLVKKSAPLYEIFKFFTENAFFELQNFPPSQKSWACAHEGSLCVDQVSGQSVKNSNFFLAKKPSSSWAPMEADIYAYRWKNTKNGVGDIHSSAHESKGVIIFNITKRSLLYRKYEAYINLEVKSPKHPKIGSHTHFPA